MTKNGGKLIEILEDRERQKERERERDPIVSDEITVMGQCYKKTSGRFRIQPRVKWPQFKGKHAYLLYVCAFICMHMVFF